MKSMLLNIPLLTLRALPTVWINHTKCQMSNGTSLCIGLTALSLLLYVRLSQRKQRDNPGCTSNTTSPIFKFFSTSYHFGLAANIGKFSLSHLCHTMDTKCCAFLQRCLGRKPSQTSCSSANCPPI